ncbi:TetR family transcriptional regulator [Litorimonas taeanensis]|uniref:TetR family transcriptional regulator n=1 Tax=Litorimonas taeanensis TaxID=568099 RepID=A0A420WLA0_9PROT|nr:TetR/AcrR family transcriptional regulator [Litorimonas taeanensis]RKQ71797.1 TetR family transcriptional regulator [Litorimonas taeanensis]
MPSRRRYSPEKRREQLVLVSIETFADMGIERTGHGDIAKRAGVSTATVFNYFPTKEALTVDVLREIETQIIAMFESVKETDDNPRNQFMALSKAYEDMISAHPATIKAYLSWSVSFNPDLRPQYLEMQTRIINMVQAKLPKALQTQSDALIIYNAANMIAIMTFDNRPQDVIQDFTERLLTALLTSKKSHSLCK